MSTWEYLNFRFTKHIYFFVNFVGNNYKFISNGIYSQKSYYDIILIILFDVSKTLRKLSQLWQWLPFPIKNTVMKSWQLSLCKPTEYQELVKISRRPSLMFQYLFVCWLYAGKSCRFQTTRKSKGIFLNVSHEYNSEPLE